MTEPEDPATQGPLIRAAREEAGDPAVRASAAAAPSDEQPGARIGRFKLLQRIGEGGFGTVWMAEQREPVQRKVALKIVKLGMDSKQVVARFEAERQALALMDHPNIARVLDGGLAPSGRPYFVMELVRGVPITEYCDRNHLTTEERLRVFLPVCRALQHAHQKGVLHRDVKPSNVLVTLHDGVPFPKVIDFGIAKALDRELTSRTLFTEFGQFIGTPEYMSPEQAEMSGLDVDTRSDVYSLGVLLYELLTGSTPIEGARLRAAGLAEIQRILREEEPPRPSTRLSTLGAERSVVAADRGAAAGALGRSLRGDLDWIVMKALEKDRTRRYGSAEALGEDLRRHLEDEPVEAGPPGALYRLRKLARRHRGGSLVAAGMLAALLGGAALATRGLVEARRAQEQAMMARQLAEHEAAAAQAANAFFVDMLDAADPLQRLYSPRSLDGHPLRGAGVALADSVPAMIRQAAASVDGAFGDRPRTEAQVREALATTLGGCGLYDEAIPHLERALALRTADQGPDHPDTLRAGLFLAAYVRGERGEALARRAVEGLSAQLGPEHAETLAAARGLARMLYFNGDVAAARALFESTLATQARVLGPEHGDTLVTRHLLSYAAHWEGWPEAEALARDVHAATARLLEDDHPFAVAARAQLAWCLLDAGRADEAGPLFESALAPCRRVLGDEHWLTGNTALGTALALPADDASGRRDELLRLALSARVSRAVKERARAALGDPGDQSTRSSSGQDR